MKMVSAAKYARAERDLKSARPFGEGAQCKFDHFNPFLIYIQLCTFFPIQQLSMIGLN